MSISTSLKAELTVYADRKPVQVNQYITIKGETFILIDSYKNTDNGYEGYAYRSLSNNDIYIVNAGSYDLSESMWNLLTNDGYNDWIKTDGEFVVNILPSQYYSANYFLNRVRSNYNNNSNNHLELLGQSLGGTLNNIICMQEGNENLLCTGFNTLGAASFEQVLNENNIETSGTYLNINNYFYANEVVSKLKEQIGNVYVSQYTETKGFKYHNIDTHIDNNLVYQLTNNFVTIESICKLNNMLFQPKIFYDVITKQLKNVVRLTGSTIENMLILFNQLCSNNLLDVVYSIEIGEDTYLVKNNDDIIDIAKKTGISQSDLIEVNSWLLNRYSGDGSYTLIKLDEQLIIPNNAKSVNNNQSLEQLINDYNSGTLSHDVPASDNVTLPTSGQTQNPETIYYTSKPNMLSPSEILIRALKEGNVDALKSVIPNADRKTLDILRVLSVLPGNPLQNANINNALNSMLNGNQQNINAILNVYGFIKTNFSYYIDTILQNGQLIPAIRIVQPMAIDLDGEGIETIDINNSQIYFDVDNDGFREQTGWISKNESILAIDRNTNGKIDNQSEMFGSTSATGFEELRELDTNNDGIINSQDTDFNKIRVWQDANENGITDDGELQTLVEAGITSISTNTETVNALNNNNVITEKATINYSNGTTKDLYDVATQYNNLYTVYGGEYILDSDVLDLPWLRGYGKAIDLQLAASQNDNLKTLITQMASMTNAYDIYNQFDNMMSMWLGENQTGTNMMKTVMSKLILLDINNLSDFQTNNIENAYTELKNKLFVNFIAQTAIADKFDISYDYRTDSVIYSDNTYTNIVENTSDTDVFMASYIIAKVLTDNGALDVTKLANAIVKTGYGAHLINYINSGLKFVNGDFQYIEGDMPLYAIGTDGDDSIVGGNGADIIYGMDGNDIIYGYGGDDYIVGGRGNDTLYGGDGNDTLIGGQGNDTLEGGGGDDTYIYDGDGSDEVLDEKWAVVRTQVWYQDNYYTDYKCRWDVSSTLVDGGNDVIVFKKDVSIEDVSFTRSGDDLVISLNNTNNTLTVNNWYATEEQRVETFQFANGLILNSNQILNMITDANTSNLVGTNGDDFMLSSSGSDTITGGLGNDIIVNQQGNTRYNFNIGDGQDTIYDYAGTDSLYLGTTESNTIFKRNQGDLVIQIKNTKDTVTIKDWFINEDNRIENVYFSDNTSININSIMANIISASGTNKADTIYGTNNNDTVHSYAGDDFVSTGAGNDIIYGGLGNDIMVGGAGNDKYYVETVDDKVIEYENEGTDSIVASCSYELPDNVENLYLYADAGAINGRGNDLDNKLVGNDFNNILDGKAGTNDLWGGAGDDTYIINASNANDVCHESADEGNDTIMSSITYTITRANIENLVLTGTADIDGRGNSMGNYIQGNSGSNVLRGVGGNDTLYGGGGVDSLYGGVDDDTYIVDNNTTLVREMTNEGNDTVLSSIDYTLTNHVENLTLTGTEDLNGSGNTMDNIIKGNSGDNILEGKTGNDTLYGGEGSDTYVFNLGDGQDTIYEEGSAYNDIDKVSFGTGISVEDVRFSKVGNDLIVSIIGTNDQLTIKNSNIDSSSRIEQFKFADNTIINGNDFYGLTADRQYDTLFSEFVTRDGNVLSSSFSRNYHDLGTIKTDRLYNANGNVVRNTQYNNGNLSTDEQYTYNLDGTVASMTDSQTTHTFTYTIENNTSIRYENIYDSNNILDTVIRTNYYNDGKIHYYQTYINGGNTYDSATYYSYDSLGRISQTELYRSVSIMNQSPTNRVVERNEYTYNSDGSLYMYNKVLLHTDGTLYNALQNVYQYNSNGQVTKATYHIGTIDGNNQYQKYKDEITYTYNSLNKLSSKVVRSGDRINGVWDLHTSEQTTYTYNDTGLLTSEIVEVGYQNNGTWQTQLDKTYTYSYNASGMLTEKSTYNASNVLVERLVNIYDEETGKLAFENKYNGNNLIESIKYEYVFDDNGHVLTQEIYNGVINNNEVTSYSNVKELAINAYNNVLTGDSNNNTLYGGDQNDSLSGGNGSDTLYGGEGNDTLDGGGNRDVMFGGKGNDTYYVGNATDKVFELADEGNDTIISDITYQLPDNVENLIIEGTRADVMASGNNINNVIIGSNASNEIRGYGGSDYLVGGTGNDTIYGGADDDTLIGGEGNDFLSGSTGNDTFFFNTGDGIDTVQEYAGDLDVVKFGDQVNKSNIAIYKDGNDLIIDYGANNGTDRITVINQYQNQSKVVERFELNDGSYMTDSDINALIQNMTAYAQNNSIEFTGVETVKNNADMMNLVASAWH